MKKRFNTTGICVERKHYMVDISDKIMEIKELIDNEFYFTINKPRQYGKTTTLNELYNLLKDEYLVINISFEGMGDSAFQSEIEFSNKFLKVIAKSLKFESNEDYKRLLKLSEDVNDLEEISEVITNFIEGASKDVILLIDEVDKSSNNQLFLSFIGMLRNKYLSREADRDITFKSVILVGLYDVKSLKLKLRKEEEAKFNSPWNIAIDFDVDMSFSPKEIATMLDDYSKYNNVTMDMDAISEEIYFYTGGYPYLVSRLCQIIDEKINKDNIKPWTREDVKKAVKIINEESNTLFESIVKNLENNSELYGLTKRVLIDGEQVVFNRLDPVISIGLTYGIFEKGEDGLEISNKIFEEIIYSYMISKIRTSTKNMSLYNTKSSFIKENGELNIEKVLKRFQQFMKEQYSAKDEKFIETHGRLLFLAFIKPIINGTGFDFKEVQISEEKRLDLVITYNNFRYIIEMKIWRGAKLHEEGLKQLCDYLDIHSLTHGYLLIFNFNSNKEFKEERVEIEGTDIFEVYV
ncbi:AAA family ATPase [Clostridium gasigenes]|uniref:GxxExxY protein n=1 Tax=Clostridium gasigenes TaxID=94869 RepID=UPI001438381A|nr:AAA-like domain-containing protein [Clostridium gasigenes]NKF07646.1 AAA family ATPase [Clostridium gasigenes]QSW18073.1 AAA family ATPase [Clostridium gasigenes]